MRILRLSLTALLLVIATAGTVQSQPTASCMPAELGSLCWNRRARELVVSHGIDPARASRIYAVLSLAQQHAITAVSKSTRRSPAPDLHERAAIESASAVVLAHLVTSDAVQADSYLAHANARTAMEARRLGREAARLVLEWFANDGAQLEHQVVPPAAVGHWRSQDSRPPLRPLWGHVIPAAIVSADRFLPPPPPESGSREFQSALEHVRRVAQALNDDERRITEFWDDAIATPTPPGHWNIIAADLITETRFGERDATRVLALINVAMMDAGIVCWRAKYTYWSQRPNEIDSKISPLLKVPNFPAYPSGHASFSAAAAEVLAALFPNHAATLRSMAEEAGRSRVLGGIHYGFDIDAGHRLGRAVAHEVIAVNSMAISLFETLRERRTERRNHAGGLR